MGIDNQKEILKYALINSFVDDYNAYKKTIDFINEDLKKMNINFEYGYDQFCIDFLNQTLKNAEGINVFDSNNSNFDKFYSNFWKFNLYNLQCMLTKKLNEFGYEYEDFYNNSQIKKQISEKYNKN